MHSVIMFFMFTLGGLQDSRSVLGCSLNRASRSSLERQHFMCLLKYFLMRGDTFIVPSLALTSEAGSKHVRPDGPADSESGSKSNLSRFVSR